MLSKIIVARVLLLLQSQARAYDPDYYSVMSSMRMENAKYIVPYWYYSKVYWATANLGYYTIP